MDFLGKVSEGLFKHESPHDDGGGFGGKSTEQAKFVGSGEQASESHNPDELSGEHDGNSSDTSAEDGSSDAVEEASVPPPPDVSASEGEDDLTDDERKHLGAVAEHFKNTDLSQDGAKEEVGKDDADIAKIENELAEIHADTHETAQDLTADSSGDSVTETRSEAPTETDVDKFEEDHHENDEKEVRRENLRHNILSLIDNMDRDKGKIADLEKQLGELHQQLLQVEQIQKNISKLEEELRDIQSSLENKTRSLRGMVELAAHEQEQLSVVAEKAGKHLGLTEDIGAVTPGTSRSEVVDSSLTPPTSDLQGDQLKVSSN